MYIELNYYNKTMSESEVIDNVFKGLRYDIKGINVGQNYLQKIASVLPDGILLSCPIDYPYGLSDTKTRQQQTISAIRRGANCIDLVVNSVYIINDQRDKLMLDLRAHQEICKQNNVLLRVMLEYRQIEDNAIYAETLKICKILRLKYIFPSTGHFADDLTDNIIVAKMINSQYSASKVICNGNLWLKSQYEFVQKSGIYGIRLNGFYELEHIL